MAIIFCKNYCRMKKNCQKVPGVTFIFFFLFYFDLTLFFLFFCILNKHKKQPVNGRLTKRKRKIERTGTKTVCKCFLFCICCREKTNPSASPSTPASRFEDDKGIVKSNNTTLKTLKASGRTVGSQWVAFAHSFVAPSHSFTVFFRV